VLHYSALRTGLSYLPLGVSIMVAAGIAPRLVRSLGVRLATTLGALLALAGLAWFARIPADGRLLTDIVLPCVVTGLGGGMVIMTTTIAGMAGVPASRHGVASALLNVSRQLGGAIGLAAISTVVTSTSARSAGPASAALTAGFRAGFTVSAILLAAAVVTALALFREDGRGQRINPVELQASA
jgi:hypothetical protein